MSHTQFIILAGLACGVMLAWGFRYLPQARWQFLACVPLREESPGLWRGLNLTWYGLLSANAQTIAAAWFLLLASSLGIAWSASAASLACLCVLCMGGSRWLAQLVESKAHTFTVGGASFLGMLLAPGLFWLCNQALAATGHPQAPLLAWCAALVNAYALGEGLGRLACISFGCCYGKPLDDCPAWLARMFARASFVFSGEHKKIAYAGGLQNRRVLPVQGLTAVIFTGAALGGTLLFLEGHFRASLLLAGLTTQGWRLISEFLRADYRGGGRLSAYQWMALATALWLGGLSYLLPAASSASPSLALGLTTLWAPWPLVLLKAIWLIAFIYFGYSRVTTSQLSFSVLRHLV